MKFTYAWSSEKNDLLEQERGLSFDLVVEAAANGLIVDEFDHPNDKRPHQRVMVIEVNGYMVNVPYVVDGNVKFLKAMFFDRALQKKYGVKNGNR
jgi:uncharacterized DUF497 family protein